MKIAARRRLAAGVVATTTALVAGLVVAPALASPNGLTISPAGAFNNDSSAELTFKTTEADLNFGADAVFSRIQGGTPFTVEISSNAPTFTAGPDREKTQSVDFTDMGDGLGSDGPADAGTYNVNITGNPNPLSGSPVPSSGGGNDTCTSCFTVVSAGPVAVTSVAPTSLRPGQAGNVSVLGNNFERGTKIEVLFPGGSVDPGVSANIAPDPTADNDEVADGITTRTELRRKFSVANGTSPGRRDVRVTNLDGNTALCEGCFVVSGNELTSTNPTFSPNDPGRAPLAVTFSSTQAIEDGEMRLEFLGNPGAVSRSELTLEGVNERNYSGTAITADFDFSNAAPGNYQPVVEGDNGVVNACRPGCIFTVDQRDERTPTLTSLDRSTLVGVQKNLRQGETAEFVATGTNFSKGATLVFTPPEGLTVTDVDFLSPERLEVTIAAAPDAAAGDKDVQVRLTDGMTSAVCDNCLTVQQGTAASPGPSASGSSSPQPGNQSFNFSRFAGGDRYATAARIATGSYTTAETVLLANGQSDDPRTSRIESHFPDALAANYLAGFRAAPTLLATETSLPQPSKDALKQLQAKNVVIIGGPAAIGTNVENELKSAGYAVTRIQGQDRYETARAVAETPPTDYVGEDPNGDKTAVVASGERYPDALVAGPLGYSAKFPVLITEAARLTDDTKAALQGLGIEHVLIPGGTAAVSQQTQDQIEALGITVERFAGTGRSETAALVAAYAYDRLGFDRAHVDLARGDQFPDALAGGPHAGVQQSPILLTADPSQIGKATEAFLRNRGSQLREGEIFGGLSAVSQQAEDQAERAIREGSASSPSPSASASSSASPSGSASPSASASGSAAPTGSASPTATTASGSPRPTTSASPTGSAPADECSVVEPVCP